jgi:hypothetical protein
MPRVSKGEERDYNLLVLPKFLGFQEGGKRLFIFGHTLIPRVPRGGGEGGKKLLIFGHILIPRVPRGWGDGIISF